jgi:hypothetical protein
MILQKKQDVKMSSAFLCLCLLLPLVARMKARVRNSLGDQEMRVIFHKLARHTGLLSAVDLIHASVVQHFDNETE